jgi:hypothetical protein
VTFLLDFASEDLQFIGHLAVPSFPELVWFYHAGADSTHSGLAACHYTEDINFAWFELILALTSDTCSVLLKNLARFLYGRATITETIRSHRNRFFALIPWNRWLGALKMGLGCTMALLRVDQIPSDSEGHCWCLVS